jgi:hypothetical protein
MATPVNFLFTDQIGVVDGSFNGVTGFTELSRAATTFVAFGGSLIIPLTLSFNDGFAFGDSLGNQPVFSFDDAVHFNDAFGLFLSEGILLLLGDMLSFSDGFFEQNITSIQFNDALNFNDQILPGAGNNPSFVDVLVFQDGFGISGQCILVLADNINNFVDGLSINEGFVTTNLILNDTYILQDTFQIVLPNVSILLVLSDNLDNFSDSLSTSNVEMLNTYLRRYLNDVQN